MIAKTRSPAELSPGFLPALLIIAAGLWIYAPTFHGDWLWDDNVYITQNPLINDPAGLWKIWFEPGTLIDYYPITSSVEFLQWKLWGMNTLGYHLTTLVLHLIDALLVWKLFSKFGLKFAWWGGLIFAVHPVMVESVAWISELKNTLSMLPLLLAMCAWIDFDRAGTKRNYFLALGLFLVALLCKMSVVMFPVVILLYTWWKWQRITVRSFVLSAPFFLMALGVGLITIVSGIWSRNFYHAGQVHPLPNSLSRIVLAGLEVAFYFSKSVLPVQLLPLYPKWPLDTASPGQYLPWLVMILSIAWLWSKRKIWGRTALLGLGFFLVNLLACPGFIPAPNMAYSWAMDHFLYLPIIGLIGLGLAALEHLDGISPPPARRAVMGLAVVLTILLAWGSRSYAEIFGNGVTLWTYAAEKNPDSFVVRANLGEQLNAQGRTGEAIQQFEIAINLNPRYAGSRYDLAYVFKQIGQEAAAIEQYKMILRVDPTFKDTAELLGKALLEAHRIPEAKEQFENALQQDPKDENAHIALGNILATEGKAAEATGHFKQASKIDPGNVQLHFVIGNAMLAESRLPEALAEFQLAAQIDPKNLDVLGNLGIVLARMGRVLEAAQQFEAALALAPNSPAAHTNMGTLLMGMGQTPEAIAQYQEALRLDPNYTAAQLALVRAQEMKKR